MRREPEASPSMERSSQTRTSRRSTHDQVSCPWPTPVPTREVIVVPQFIWRLTGA